MIFDVSTMLALFLAAGLANLTPVHAGSSNGLQAPDSLNRRSSDSVSSSFSRKRRHANLSKHARADKRQLGSLFQATGFGTLYYDVNGGGTCGPVNGWYSYPETQGYTACEPWQNSKTIAQRGSNRIVAIPSNMLNGNTAKYCGKAVSVTWNGNTVNDLIVWDGCASCNTDNGIDFSSTIFGELVSEKNCGMGRVNGVTWKILDKQIWDLNGNPVSGNDDGDDGGEDKPDPKPQPEPKPTTTSTKAQPSPTSSSSSSSSTETVEEPSSSPKPTTSSKAQEPSSSEEDTPSSSSTSTKSAPSKSPEKPVEAEPTTTSSPAFTPTSLSSIFTVSSTSTLSPSFSQGVPHHNGAGKPPSFNSASSTSSDDDASPSATVAPSPPANAPSVSPSAPEEVDPSYDESGLPTCENPGQWRCNDKNGLEQCISRLDGKGWIWFLRLNCGTDAPLNCDTANPVCPNGAKKRTCPVKVSKL